MEVIQRRSLVDTAVEQIRQEIAAGTWPIGSRIPSETELTGVLGVSRPSVREAVRALAQLGLLEIRQGDGTYVVADDPTEVALRRAILVADSREVIRVRRALDALAAREAALHRDDEALTRLRRHLDARREALEAGDGESFADHDVRFHLEIASASGNRLLRGIYASFDGSLRESVNDTSCITEDRATTRSDLHDVLYDAIEAGSPDAAVTAALGVLDEQEHLLEDSP